MIDVGQLKHHGSYLFIARPKEQLVMNQQEGNTEKIGELEKAGQSKRNKQDVTLHPTNSKCLICYVSNKKRCWRRVPT